MATLQAKSPGLVGRQSVETPRGRCAPDFLRETAVLTVSEQAVLDVFRDFQVATGEMLCFHGPRLDKLGVTLEQLAKKDLLVKERFAGRYSLTPAGFSA